MPFPKNVNLYPSAGVAGDLATENPAVYGAINPFAEGEVTVGNFVYQGTTVNQAKATGTTIKPIGIVRRLLQYPNYNVTAEASMSLPDGTALTVVKFGDIFVRSLTTAKTGQKVFASTVDGSIKTDVAGATVADFIETDWVVVTDGAVGDIIVITSWVK